MGRYKEVNEHLPPRMLFRHGAYYRTPRINGRQLMQHLGRDYQAALEAYYELEGVPKEDRKIWRLPDKKITAVLDNRGWKRGLFRQAKAKARHLGVEFSLTFEEFCEIAKVADGKCQVTRIPFELRFVDGERRRQWAPSLDRIEPRKGYTFENCRLVCVAVNIAMNNWGIDVLLKIARALKDQRLI